jgi:hypothetical protein
MIAQESCFVPTTCWDMRRYWRKMLKKRVCGDTRRRVVTRTPNAPFVNV